MRIWRHNDESSGRSSEDVLLSDNSERLEGFLLQLGSSVSDHRTDDELAIVLAQAAKDAATEAPTTDTGGRITRPLTMRWRRRVMIGTFLSTLLGKLTVGAAAFAVATSGLAVTGNLPEPAQQWASDAVNRVGIEIPAPQDIAEEGEEARVAPVLPEEADDTAKAVIERVFGGNPYDGIEFGGSIASSASAGVADDGLERAGEARPDEPNVPAAPDLNTVPDGIDIPDDTKEVDEPVVDGLDRATDAQGEAESQLETRP
jgi:hypothetical protein